MMLLYLWLMLFLVVGWITATHFSGVSSSSIYVNYSTSHIVQPELYQTPCSRYTSITPVLKKFHWLPVEHHTVSKTVTLVHKSLHTSFPKYFAPYFYSYSKSYSTRCSQSDGNFLVTPKFYPSIHKSIKQFGYNFAFDATTVGNAVEICAFPPYSLFQKEA